MSLCLRVSAHGKCQNALKKDRFATKNGSTMGQKRASPKLIPDHSGCSNKCFGPILSPWGRALAHGKPQNALKRGYFATKNGSTMGQKRASPKLIPDHSGCSNKCFGPILSPWGRALAHGKPQNALKRGYFATKNGSKMREKRYCQNWSYATWNAQTNVFSPCERVLAHGKPQTALKNTESDPAPFGNLQKVFFAHFVPVGTRFGPWKIPKRLEKGRFCDQKSIKTASKRDFGPFGVLKQVFLALFEPLVPRFGPWKIPKCLEKEPCWDQKWFTYWSKTRFSKKELPPFVMLKQVFLAHFEPVGTRFGAWKIPKCLENGWFGTRKGSTTLPTVILDHSECSNKCF